MGNDGSVSGVRREFEMAYFQNHGRSQSFSRRSYWHGNMAGLNSFRFLDARYTMLLTNLLTLYSLPVSVLVSKIELKWLIKTNSAAPVYSHFTHKNVQAPHFHVFPLPLETLITLLDLL